MEKVYVVQVEWTNEGKYEDHYDASEIVAVVKTEEKASEMCKRLRREKLAQLLADEPDNAYDLIDNDDLLGEVCALHVNGHWLFDSTGTYYWWYKSYDVIGS